MPDLPDNPSPNIEPIEVPKRPECIIRVRMGDETVHKVDVLDAYQLEGLVNFVLFRLEEIRVLLKKLSE